jgi:PAS domain S-box-containing protein
MTNKKSVLPKTDSSENLDEARLKHELRSNGYSALEKQIEETQSFLLGGNWAKLGIDFFEYLAKYLANTLGMDYVCIDRLLNNGLEAETVAIYFDGKYEDNVTYSLKDTPCGDVVGHQVCCFPKNVRNLFPTDIVLQEMLAESYLGVTLWGADGKPLGLIAVIGRKPLLNIKQAELILKQVSIRAASELEHRQIEEKLKKKDEHLHAILASAMDGFWISDIDGCFIEVNDSYCRMSGYTSQELLTMKISDLECVETKEEVELHKQKIIEKGEDRFETLHRRKDGSVFNVEVSVQYRPVEGGQFVSFFHDITKRKQNDEITQNLLNIVQQERDKLSSLINNMTDEVWFADVNKKITLINPPVLNEFGDKLINTFEIDKFVGSLDIFRLDGSPLPVEESPTLRALKGEVVRNFEEIVRVPSTNQMRYREKNSSPVKDDNGNILGAVTVVRDITERKMAEEALIKSEEKFSAIYKNSPHAISLSSFPENMFVDVNKAFENIFGYSREEVIGKNSRNFGLKDDDAKREKLTEEIRKNGFAHDQEDVFYTKSGEERILRYNIDIVDINNEKYILSTAEDITRLKETEILRSKYNIITQYARDPMLLMDINGNIIEGNHAAIDFYGYSREELLGLNIFDIRLQEEKQLVAKQIELAKSGGVLFEAIHKHKNGTTLPVEVSARGVNLDGKQFLLSVIRDITERKRSEEALLQAKEDWERTFDAIPDLISIIDRNHRIVRANKAMNERIKVRKKQCIGTHCYELMHRTDGPPAFCPHSKLLIDGQMHEAEFYEHHLDGDFLVTTTPLKDKQGEIIGSVHIARDITERKKAEDALRQSEERVRLKLQSILSPEGSIADLELNDIIDAPGIQKLMDNLYELSPIPMAIIDNKGKVLVGVGWQDICTKFHRIHPESCRNCIESDTHLTQDIPDGEFKLYKCKNNMWDMATPIIIGGEHKGNLFMGQFFFDDEPIDHKIFIKQATKYGFAEQEYMDALYKAPRFSKQKLNHAKAFFLALSRSISQLSYSNIKLARAISQQKKVEEALRESEDFLNKAQEMAHLGSWSLDLIKNQLTWSDEIYRIFGLQKQEFPSTYEGFLDAVHPEDQDDVNAAYTDSILEGRDNYEVEHRIVRKNSGEVRHVSEKCEHIKDASGKIVRSVGMIHDITERKAKEEALRKLNQTLAALGKSSQAMVYSEDEVEYMKQVCDIIVDDCGFAMVWIGLAEDDEAKSVRPVACAGFEDGYLDTLNVSWADTERGHGPTGTAIRTGTISMCWNMLTDPTFEPWREQAIKRGYASSIVFPLMSGEKVFGAITIYSREPNPFENDEIKVLSELASDLSHGITSIRLRAAKKRAEEELSRSHSELEMLVKERTRELEITNEMLHNEIKIRAKQEQSLALAEEKYRTVADFTSNWENWIDPYGKFIYVSPSCSTITGYTVEEFMNDPQLIIAITHPDDREIVEKHQQEEMKAITSFLTFDFRIIDSYGDERWIGHSCRPVFSSEGKWLGRRGSNRDITEQKKAEKILIDSKNHLRELTQRMDAVAEEERIRISREIHDELGHLLTALKFDIEDLTSKTDLSVEMIKIELEGMVSMVEALIDSVRKIATELRPGILDHLGLFPAIEWKIKEFRLRNKLCCEYSIAEMDVNFNKNETTIIYRILQEIFTNITRHSKADKVQVSINKEDDMFVLSVTDNGVGFELNENNQFGSLGLMGMRERALSIGGEIKIKSAPGKGTTVRFLQKK